MNVASLEVVAVNTVVGHEVEVGLLSLLSGGEDAQGLVAIEGVGHLANLGADGGTIDLVVEVLLAIGQVGNLVLVVTSAGAQLPLPVLQSQQLGGEAHVEAFVLQLTTVVPVHVKTAEEAQRLAGEQVVGVGTEVVDAERQAVVQQVGLKAYVEATGGLPLDFIVANAVERQTRDGVQELRSAEVASGGIEVDVVVTADVVASREAQVVNALHASHPRLVADDPSSLQAGEDGPRRLENLDVAGILAEA